MKTLKKGTRLSKSLITAVIGNIIGARSESMKRAISAQEQSLIELAQTKTTALYGGFREDLTSKGMFPLTDTLTFINDAVDDEGKRVHFSETFPIPYRTQSNGTVILSGDEFEQVTALTTACDDLAKLEQSITEKLTSTFKQYDNAKDLVEEHAYVMDYLPPEYVEEVEEVKTASLDDVLGVAA
jgi:hypothetical protein